MEKEKINSIIFIMIFAITFCFTSFFITSVRVSGRSMYPTLRDGEMGICLKTAQTFDYGDIVIVEGKGDNKEEWVKRIIAKSGDTVSCKDNIVYLNGKPLEEPYLSEDVVTLDFVERTVEDGCYFLMGDNRLNSTDSRIMGTFTEDEIEAKWLFGFGGKK